MIKKILKSIVPVTAIQWIRKVRYSKRRSQFFGHSTEDAFKKIYKDNLWNSEESPSGTGSESKQTAALIKKLDLLLTEIKIHTLLDIPCGDFIWMNKVNLSRINYIGADIVADLVEKNNQQYKSSSIQFAQLDLIKDPLPKCDLIFTRDCLVHLSNKDILKAIKNIIASGSKYLLTTTFVKHSLNYDITTGDWRAINLLKPPFNFPPPLRLINEGCSEGDFEYSDKSMGLWKISDLSKYLQKNSYLL